MHILSFENLHFYHGADPGDEGDCLLPVKLNI